jgi:hypothetical protein
MSSRCLWQRNGTISRESLTVLFPCSQSSSMCSTALNQSLDVDCLFPAHFGRGEDSKRPGANLRSVLQLLVSFALPAPPVDLLFPTFALTSPIPSLERHQRPSRGDSLQWSEWVGDRYLMFRRSNSWSTHTLITASVIDLIRKIQYLSPSHLLVSVNQIA